MSIVPYSSRQHRFDLHAYHRFQSRTNHVVERDYLAVARNAKALGLEIPISMQLLADEIIE